jgi:hypothetical protein
MKALLHKLEALLWLFLSHLGRTVAGCNRQMSNGHVSMTPAAISYCTRKQAAPCRLQIYWHTVIDVGEEPDWVHMTCCCITFWELRWSCAFGLQAAPQNNNCKLCLACSSTLPSVRPSTSKKLALAWLETTKNEFTFGSDQAKITDILHGGLGNKTVLWVLRLEAEARVNLELTNKTGHAVCDVMCLGWGRT